VKFGIDHLFTWRRDRPQADVIHEAISQTVLADDLNFDGCWLAEHHFSDYGIVGGLSTMGAALAQATARIRIGLAVAVLPLSNPIRLAEDLALLDVISRGRLDVGVGRGYQPAEFAHFGIPFEEATRRFDEVLEILKLAWTTETFSYHGEFYEFDEISVLPHPIQKPHPPIFHAAVSASTFERVAKQGLPILTSPNFTPIEVVKRNFQSYRASLTEAGFPIDAFDYPMLQQVYVSEDEKDAVETPRPYAMYHYDRLSHLLPSIDRDDIPDEFKDYGKFQRNIEELKYDVLVEHGINVGTPETVIEGIRRLQAEAGVNYYIGWFNFGGMPGDKVERSMRLFAEEVMPAFRDQRDDKLVMSGDTTGSPSH
jgi:alkanesulfonate monooxygenase SsuD/methylene tetrahydromethanopterin reductase-like flavin-dependent oxidoreductase (luciferase family)